VKLKKAVNNTISSRVYELLKDNIISLAMTPGMSISEKEIATQLEVSRTPVREALVRLGQEDLVQIFPQKGSQVSLINLKSVRDGLFIRISLEKEAIKLAAQNFNQDNAFELRRLLEKQEEAIQSKSLYDFFKMDENFHEAIVNISGNQLIWPAIQRVDADLKRIRVLTLLNQEKSRIVLGEHRKILNALESNDSEKAIQILESHMVRLNFEENKLVDKYPNYFE